MRRSEIRGLVWWARHWRTMNKYPTDRYWDAGRCWLYFQRNVITVVNNRRIAEHYEYPYSMCACDFCPYIGKGVQSDLFIYRVSRSRRHNADSVYGRFCQKCSAKTAKQHRKELECLETRRIINKTLETLKHGSDENNGAASPVSG